MNTLKKEICWDYNDPTFDWYLKKLRTHKIVGGQTCYMSIETGGQMCIKDLFSDISNDYQQVYTMTS